MLLLLGIVGLAYAHPSVECPTDGKQYLLPHEYDCSKFYSCVRGRKQDQAYDCPVNTLFSFEKQICDQPHLVNCVNSVRSTATLGCPTHFFGVLRLPHENDCGKYYNCVLGNRVLINCEAGKHFNAVTQRCDATQCNPGVEDSGNNNGLQLVKRNNNGNNNCNKNGKNNNGINNNGDNNNGNNNDGNNNNGDNNNGNNNIGNNNSGDNNNGNYNSGDNNIGNNNNGNNNNGNNNDGDNHIGNNNP